MKLLRGERPGGVFIQDATELQIAIDFNHEPWKTLAIKVLHCLNEELEEMGFEIAGVDDMIDLIFQTKGDIQ